MSDSNQQNPSAAGGDDINRLFAKMGGEQGHASAYRDFTYNRLLGRPLQPASPEASAEADARVEVQSTTTAPLRKLRVAEVEVEVVPVDAVAVTPLQQMFQRLLAAEAPNQASGPLKRLFSR